MILGEIYELGFNLVFVEVETQVVNYLISRTSKQGRRRFLAKELRWTLRIGQCWRARKNTTTRESVDLLGEEDNPSRSSLLEVAASGGLQ